MKNIFTLIFLTLSLTIFSQDTTRILFLGNSYTYGNDLPNILKQLALAEGKVIVIDQNTPGGHTLNGHSNNTTSLNKIREGNWDYVILQEQSQLPSFPPSQVETDVIPYAKALCDTVEAYNDCAQVLFFMTWGRRYGDSQNCQYYEPLCTYEGMSKRLKESYLLMAEENDALVSPVGAAWSHSKLTDSTIVLHSGDNSHPNINGSYLAACVFYSSIYQESTIGSTYTAGIDQSIVDYLQQISHDVVIDSLGNWFLDKHEIIADFGINSMNDIVMFNASSSTNGNYYTWDFGDGNTYNSDEVSVEYSYSEPGEYNVQLIVSNENPECDYENVEPDTTEMSIIISSTGLLNHQNKIKVTITVESLHIQSGIPLSCIQLYSIDGRLVKDTDISSNSFDLQVEALYTGIYLLRIEDATGYWTTEKLFVENR